MAGPLDEAVALPTERAPRGGISVAGERASILIVDDRPDKHLVFKAILDELDQNLVHVNSGEEALRQVLQRDFAVILLDVNMPGVDGLETAALIRRRKRSAHIPIIFITANYGDDAHVTRGYALGAVDFMISPVVPEVLRSKVKVFVDLYLLAQLARRQAEEHGALAAERAARAEAERANRRSAFMANASAALGRSLAITAASRELPRLAIPFLADVSAVTLGPDAGIDARTELAWFDSGPGPALRTDTVATVECPWWGAAIQRVIETGHPESFDATVQAPVEAGGPAAPRAPLEIPRGTPITSLIVVPLIARARTLGALSLGLGPSGRTFRPDDVAMVTDLANRAAMAIDNALLYRTIREQDRRKNEFLAMLAHELRNPLTPITNALYIMDQPGVDSEKHVWAKKVVSRQVRLLGRLVDDLLDVSRITQGKITLRIEDVDVAEVVAAAVETARPLIDARQHRFTMTLRETSLRVKGDFARLAQVLANLLNNAAKYTEPNGNIWLTVARTGEEIVFSVRDSGMGIPAESLASIFDLFAQSERTLDRSQGGLGIGLTLVRRLVEMQGGSVSVKSEGHDSGSEFTVRMPAGKAAEAAPVTPLATAPTQHDAPHEGCLLVVDDNRDAAQSMAVLLRMEGYVVHIAYDGPTALEAVRKTQPRAVLLDIGLPGVDGFQVAERIRAMPGGARILLIAISGYGQDELRRQAQQTGFDRHFVKPIDPSAITRLLETERQPGERSAAGNVVAFQKNR
jgi:signal transduction histidine kinase/DNA-binding response OmpR family regulator